MTGTYDMAVVVSKGYSARPAGSCSPRCLAGAVKIFTLNDADPAGYNIGRTPGEATEGCRITALTSLISA